MGKQEEVDAYGSPRKIAALARRRSHLGMTIALALGLALALSRAAASTGVPAPEFTDQQMEQFLKSAAIGKSERLSIGVTRSQRATLSDGSLSHDAHIQTIDEFKQYFETERGIELNFYDSYRFNIAAYRLDRLIGLNMVPVSVERTIGRRKASVTWWIDDVQMMELTRVQQKIVPPDTDGWNDQMYRMRVFTQLIANGDLNRGNILITNDWQVRLVDFTRAFRTSKALSEPDKLVRIDRGLYEALQRLDPETLNAALGDVLLKGEISSLLARRNEILRHFEERQRQFGDTAVFCDRLEH